MNIDRISIQTEQKKFHNFKKMVTKLFLEYTVCDLHIFDIIFDYIDDLSLWIKFIESFPCREIIMGPDTDITEIYYITPVVRMVHFNHQLDNSIEVFNGYPEPEPDADSDSMPDQSILHLERNYRTIFQYLIENNNGHLSWNMTIYKFNPTMISCNMSNTIINYKRQ